MFTGLVSWVMSAGINVWNSEAGIGIKTMGKGWNNHLLEGYFTVDTEMD